MKSKSIPIPVAISLTSFNGNKTNGVIKLCYVIKSPEKAGSFWDTKIIKKVKIDYYSVYETLVISLCDKYRVPYIPDIMRSDVVTQAHVNILKVYGIFVHNEKGIIYESIGN